MPIDGRVLTTQTVGRSQPRRFYDVKIPVPAAMVEGKESVTLRFESHQGSQIAAVFGVRLIRADTPR